MRKVAIIINDNKVVVPEGTTILDACHKLEIDIPTLCHHPDQKGKANCRLCSVEIEGYDKLQTSCSTLVKEGMNIKTHTERVVEERKILLDLILASHDFNCLACKRNTTCELQQAIHKIGLDDTKFDNALVLKPIENNNPAIVRDPNKCIKCGRCVEMCTEVQGLNILDEMGRSSKMTIEKPYGKYLTDMACTFCGQCAAVCPVAAITEKEEIEEVLVALKDENKHVIVQVAPAVRVAIGEYFGLEPGSINTGKLITSLKRLGFDKVFDTNFAADLTIIEETYELYNRVNNGGVLPMITSCSPGWINFIEQYYPRMLDHLSSCKSPQQMFGTIAKTYYSEKIGIDPKDIYVVSIMPCTAKKFEAKREEMKTNGIPDVDAVLTTRELGKMIKEADIEFQELEDSVFDEPLGIATGAGTIFGNTGGVMEAALRTFYELATKKPLSEIDFKAVRGMEGMREATIIINNQEVKVAVVHTLKNARKILEQIKNNKSKYTFIEVMCCPGGCIGGGGQPHMSTKAKKQKRIEALYKMDSDMEIRKSHKNPAIIKLYDDYLGQPLGEKAHELLHTKYYNRKK